MAELQTGSLDEVTFQAELATAQAALEGNQVAEASRRLNNLYGQAPGEEGPQAVLLLLRQALLAQPARWERLLEDAAEMKTQVEHLLERRDWMRASQILETAGQDPEMDVALEQLGMEVLRAQVAAGMQALAEVATAKDRAVRLAEAGQRWEALTVLAGLPLERVPTEEADRVVEMQAQQLAALQARADAGEEDAGRIARTVLRLLPQTHGDSHTWAERHVDGAWQAETEALPNTVPNRRLMPSGDDDERQALYTQACLALSAGDRAQAQQLLKQVGSYRSAQRLLQSMEE